MGSCVSKSEKSNTCIRANVHPKYTKMVQNVLLIWLDCHINETDVDCQKTISQLRTVVNTINTFTNVEECIQFLREIQHDKVCAIVSGGLGQHFVSCVHDLTQIDSIFIFCGNQRYHERWAKDWSKIKGVYSDIKIILNLLKQSIKDCEQNFINFSLVSTVNDITKMDLDRLDPNFIYSQILKEILFKMKFEHKHILDFIHYCRETLNEDDAALFEHDYQTKTPIWWYTSDSFLYPMFNRALRLLDFDVIMKMAFFIVNLHQQIEDLHRQQLMSTNAEKVLTVYRGQEISKKQFKQMSESKDGLICFTNFLLTTAIEKNSVDFAKRALLNPDMIGVLFVMIIDLKQSTIPFTSVDQTNEILFPMHTVFHIKNIRQIDENQRLFRVELELIGDNDQDLQILTKHIHEKTYPDKEGWSRLGLVSQKLGRPQKAEEVYRYLLTQETDESKNGWLYDRLGLCMDDQGEYEEARRFYEKSIAIYEQYSPNDPNLAETYHRIGKMYYYLGEYDKSLSSYEKSLVFRQSSIPSNHPDLAISYSGIAGQYFSMKEYTKALLYNEKALGIQQQSLPANHPSLARSYISIGNVYSAMGEYTKALSSYEKALAIQQQSLPPHHPDLAYIYNNLALVCENMEKYTEAYSFIEITSN